MSWFSLFTDKQKLQHKVKMLEDTVRTNMIADMEYRLKEYTYHKEVLKKTFIPLAIGGILVLIIYQCL